MPGAKEHVQKGSAKTWLLEFPNKLQLWRLASTELGTFQKEAMALSHSLEGENAVPEYDGS